MIIMSDLDLVNAARPTFSDPPFLVPAARRARLLIVDDEPQITEQLTEVFTSLGYDVDAFINPFAARSRFNADPGAFDLVLSDLSMPGLDGCELARHVLARRPLLPVLIYTGHLTDYAAQALEALGVRRVLTKPTSLSVITRVVADQIAV